MAIGIDAIQQYVHNRSPDDRLVIKNNELQLVNKSTISGWSCFKAQFGCGDASMKKVASYINRNRNNLFPDDTKADSIRDKNAMNVLIKCYNHKRFFFKKGKNIKDIEAETIAIFGAKQWKKCGIKVEDAPPIPANLQQIYSAPCPIWKRSKTAKTIGDTHILFLVPKMLNNEKTTVNRIRKIAKQHCAALSFHTNDKILKNVDGHKSIHESYWVLMTKKVVPSSRGIPFSTNHIPENYDIPHIIEADICMLTQYLRGRKLTDQSKLIFRHDATYCHEVNNDGYRSVVGDCDKNGYTLTFPTPQDCDTGIAVVQRL